MLNVDESRDAVECFLDRLDEESYSAMFRVMTPRVFRYFRLRGCSRDMSEDLTQEVMFIVYTQIRRLRNRDLFRSWLFQIARNAWLQHRRQQNRRVPASALDDLDEVACPTNADPADSSRFGEWMARLKPQERELLVLRYLEGFEYHELASMLNIPIGTVQWRVFQLKKTLAGRAGVPQA